MAKSQSELSHLNAVAVECWPKTEGINNRSTVVFAFGRVAHKEPLPTYHMKLHRVTATPTLRMLHLVSVVKTKSTKLQSVC